MKKIKSRKIKLKNQVLINCFFFFVVMICLVYFGSNVEAGMNDSLLEKKRIDNIYAIATINGNTRLFYLNMYEMNGRVSYCIDLGVDINTSIYHSTDDFSVSYLNEESVEYIRTISYFGYGYNNYNDYRYYMAAQELIWEYLGNELDVVWTSELDIDGELINIESYKRDILNSIEMDNKKLNINNYDGGEYVVGEDVVFTDISNVISEYEVVSSRYSDVSIDDNKLIVKVGNVIGNESIELRKKRYYDYDSSLYYYDGSQRLISNGNYKELKETIRFDIKGVSLTGKVIDNRLGINEALGDAVLAGAIYEIYNSDGDLVGTYKSNTKGYFKVDNLPLGTYYIKQIEASKGYLVNSESFKVEVNANNLEVRLPQRVIYNYFEIKKVYGSDGVYKPENGILFLVYDSKGNHYCYLFTDSNGSVSFGLPYGSYTIHQYDSTFGYSVVDDFYIEVKEQNSDVFHYNLVDELIKVKVSVNSFDVISKEKISLDGFSYKIRKREENTYLEFNGNSIFRADNKGDLIIPIFLSYGDYILEQVEVPDGVILSDDIYEFKVDDNSNFSLINDNLVMDVSVNNEFVMGKIKIKALEEVFYSGVNEYGYEMIDRENNQFELVANDEIIMNNKVIYNRGDIVCDSVTNIDGSLVIDNLHLGSYCLIDRNTSEEKCFILESDDNKTKIVEKDFEFVKRPVKGEIIINNFSNNGDVIVGSVFEILDKNDIVIFNGITNDEGVVKVSDIIFDNYCIRQKVVPSNYVKDSNNICFVLDGIKEVDVINDIIINDTIVVPDTFSDDIGFYEFFVILLMMGIGVVVYKKIFASRL